MEFITNTEQREAIQEFIQTEMLKRGFTAKIVKFEEVEGRHETRLEFTTEEFQTTPVLFKSIRVSNFSSSIRKETLKREDAEDLELHSFWISVYASFEVFSGGTNGTILFNVNGKLHNGRVYEMKAS